MRCTLMLSILLSSFPLLGAADDAVPAPSNVRGAPYPRIHPDLRVTFRVTAPTAQKVQLQPGAADNGLGTGPMDMERGKDDEWSGANTPNVPLILSSWLLV